jgi:hypothetical protein
MRPLIVLSFVLTFASFAASQVDVVSGTATTATPGTYSQPFEPVVTTPEIQFSSSPLQVGASNATSGLVAGARNSTSGVLSTSQPASEVNGVIPATESANATLDMGVATSQESVGVAQLAPKAPEHKSTRSFTNDDIDRLKQ